MRQPHARHSIRHALRLARSQRIRHARTHIAEGTGPRAGIAHHHKSRVLLFPALANIGATSFLANGDEFVAFHNLARFEIKRRSGCFHADPIRLPQYRRIRPLGLFRMARAVPLIDHRDHETLPLSPNETDNPDEQNGPRRRDDQIAPEPALKHAAQFQPQRIGDE